MAVQPDVGIAVDVGHATDYPDIDKRSHGDVSLRQRPDPHARFQHQPEGLRAARGTAGEANVLVQFEGDPRGTGTDANAIQLSRGGRRPRS